MLITNTDGFIVVILELMTPPTPSARHQLRQPRLAEMVAGALRARILSGELADGAMLPKQDELLEEFGVSLPPIREALRILETEGLITVQRGNVGGAVVHAPAGVEGRLHDGPGAAVAGRRRSASVLDAVTAFEPACAAACAARPDRADDRAARAAGHPRRGRCRHRRPRRLHRAWPASSTSTWSPTAATRPCASSSARSSRCGPCTSTTWPGATTQHGDVRRAWRPARPAPASTRSSTPASRRATSAAAELLARAHYAGDEPGWGESVDTAAVVSADLLEGR